MLLALVSSILVGDSICSAARCSCRTSSDSANTACADVVFTGEILLVDEQPDADRSVALVRVLSRLKGNTPDTVRVQTGIGGGDCGVPFAPGGPWTVYAQARQGEWWTNICVGTRPIGAPLPPARGPQR
jgi:hypothetical protein